MDSIRVKKGASIIGVRSESLHKRVQAYVDAAKDENVTMSSVVRDAIREKIERLEAEKAANASALEEESSVERAADARRRGKPKRNRPTSWLG